MNIRSAELLNQSLQSLADNFYRNRALEATMQEEAQRNAVEQSFRNAMMQHYSDTEQRQADTADKQAGFMQGQAQQGAVAQKQDYLKMIMSLNATGQLSDKGRDAANKWLATDPDLSKTGIQLQASPNPSTDPTRSQSALTQAMTMFESLRHQAASATDPAQKAQLTRYANDLEDAITHARPTETDTTAEPGTSARTTTKSFSLPGQAANPGAADDESGDDAPGADTPAMPLSVPGAASLGQKPAGMSVPIPAPTNGGQISLSPQDLTPVTRSMGNSSSPQFGMTPGAGNPANANGIPTGQPDPRDVQWLGQNPTAQRISRFENIYGPGSSSPFLTPPPAGQQ